MKRIGESRLSDVIVNISLLWMINMLGNLETLETFKYAQRVQFEPSQV